VVGGFGFVAHPGVQLYLVDAPRFSAHSALERGTWASEIQLKTPPFGNKKIPINDIISIPAPKKAIQ
jgi:hypothetical protein